MPNLPGVLVALASVVVVLVALVLAIRALSRRGGLGNLDAPPDEIGRVLAEAEGLYLATTLAGAPLQRARIPELVFRDRAVVTAHDGGVRVLRRDGLVFWIPVERLTGAGIASHTIDRGVEPGGITLLGWTLGETAVESAFRFDDDATALIGVVERIRDTAPASPQQKELP